jgi:hypothetical protein
MLGNGTYVTIAAIAMADKISESCVGRVLRLTALAPDIVDATLGGRQPVVITLAVDVGRMGSAATLQMACFAEKSSFGVS